VIQELIDRFKQVIPDSRLVSSVDDGMKDSDEFLYVRQIGDYEISDSNIEHCGIKMDARYKLICKTFCKNTPEVLKMLVAIIMQFDRKTLKVSLDSEMIYKEETGLTLAMDADFIKITFGYTEYIDLNCIGDICGNCC